MSDSDSDDDIPIAQRANFSKQTESSSSSDSDSDDDIPIAQRANIAKNNDNKKKYNIDDSSSSSDDDDIPLIPKLKQKQKQKSKSKSISSSISSMSISSSSILSTSKKAPSSDRKAPSTPSSASSTPKRIPKRKLPSSSSSSRSRRKRARFADSDSDSDYDESSSDDNPIVPSLSAATIQQPKKKRKGLDGSPIRRNNNNHNNFVGTLSPKKKKKGNASAPGYIGRECNPVHLYQVKDGIVPLEAESGAVKWWETKNDNVVSYSVNNDSKNKIKWNTLDHNGIVFAPPYIQHFLPLIYDGKSYPLSLEQEEIATMFGVMIETDWAKKEKFRKNFMREFIKILRDKKQKYQYPFIRDLNKCDFRAMYEWYQDKREKEKIKKKDVEYKLKIKEEKEEYDSLYGWALVDGIREKVGNYKVEPPGLFRGRGEHPKMGQLKKRILPENIILNIGSDTKIPPCPLSGHNWGGVIHDGTVTYIAKWVENINGQHKFVYLSASSRFKGENDRNKYEKARLLKSKISFIRNDYETKLTNSSLMLKQLATAVWMIDKLSIRVGNEKDTDEEADTVGVCSLRKEHMTLLDPIPIKPEKDESSDSSSDSDDDTPINQLKNKYIYKITLDFLGKDSMRYHNTVKVTQQIHKNLKVFLNGKKDDMDIFEKIDPNKVNDYLKEKMDGLTAKVFRTHNASTTLQEELNKSYHSQIGAVTKNSPLSEKIFFYNQCNKQVAILCNHQRSVSKTHQEQLEKMDKQIGDIKKLIRELKEELDIVTGKKKKRKYTKSPTKGKGKKKKSAQQLKNQINKKKEQLQKKQLQKAMKEDNKEVALGTSKINYMDPRITVSWCKKMKIPIEKIFNKSLLDKFPWAMQSNTKYIF